VFFAPVQEKEVLGFIAHGSIIRVFNGNFEAMGNDDKIIDSLTG